MRTQTQHVVQGFVSPLALSLYVAPSLSLVWAVHTFTGRSIYSLGQRAAQRRICWELCLVNIFDSVVFNKKIGQRPHTTVTRTKGLAAAAGFRVGAG